MPVFDMFYVISQPFLKISSLNLYTCSSVIVLIVLSIIVIVLNGFLNILILRVKIFKKKEKC